MRLAAAVLALSAAVAGGIALRAADLGQEPWSVSRASGLVAFALLSASVVLGLLLSTRIGRRLLPGRLPYDLHTSLGVLMLTFVAIHGGALLFDGFFAFTPLDLLVPFLSPYEPFWTGVGVAGAWAAAIVAASVRFRRRIGYTAWRRLHFLSFGAYLASLLHGVSAGTDTGLAGVQVLYLGSAGLVAALVLVRILVPAPGRPPRRTVEAAPARSSWPAG